MLRALALVDVSQDDIPTGDASIRIAQGKPSDLTPPVDAIEPPNACIEVVGSARRDRRTKHLTDMREIVWMNRPVRAPLPHRLQRLPAVLDKLVIDDVDLARRRQDGDQAGNRVHDQARLALAFLSHLLRPLTLRQIDDEGDALVRSSIEERAAGEDLVPGCRPS